MTDLAFRAPSVEDLFDAWSIEPLGRRPLSDEARERILDEWTHARKHATGTPTVTLRLPEEDRHDGLDAAIAAAVRHDMETMAIDARRRWIRRSLRPRETRIGIALFFAVLTISAAFDYFDESGETLIGQVFVVLAWVALWAPAQRIITAASFRMARKYFAELAVAEVRVSWETD